MKRAYCQHCPGGFRELEEGERPTIHRGRAKPRSCCFHCKPYLNRNARPAWLDLYTRPDPDDDGAADAPPEGVRDISKNVRAGAAATSAQAAEEASWSAKKRGLLNLIYEQLKAMPQTADQVAKARGMVLNTARARISDLKAAGWVADSGQRKPTLAGKPAVVWRAVPPSERLSKRNGAGDERRYG